MGQSNTTADLKPFSPIPHHRASAGTLRNGPNQINTFIPPQS
jgi:hypothetical protein